jgi:hypothetical protein
VLDLSGDRTQNLRRKVKVTAECPIEDCEVVGRATVRVPTPRRAGVSRKFSLKKVKKSLPRGLPKKLRLKLKRRARRAIKRALRHGRKVRVKFRVTATDAAGNESIRKRKVKLRLG